MIYTQTDEVYEAIAPNTQDPVGKQKNVNTSYAHLKKSICSYLHKRMC